MFTGPKCRLVSRRALAALVALPAILSVAAGVCSASSSTDPLTGPAFTYVSQEAVDGIAQVSVTYPSDGATVRGVVYPADRERKPSGRAPQSRRQPWGRRGADASCAGSGQAGLRRDDPGLSLRFREPGQGHRERAGGRRRAGGGAGSRPASPRGGQAARHHGHQPRRVRLHAGGHAEPEAVPLRGAGQRRRRCSARSGEGQDPGPAPAWLEGRRGGDRGRHVPERGDAAQRQRHRQASRVLAPRSQPLVLERPRVRSTIWSHRPTGPGRISRPSSTPTCSAVRRTRGPPTIASR